MKLHWAPEQSGQITLRTANDAPLAIVGQITKHTDLWRAGERGFTAVILQPGYPDAGPFKTRAEAVAWTQAWVKRHWYARAEFAEFAAEAA